MREIGLVRLLVDIGLLACGIAIGWLLPSGFVPKSWRVPLAALLIGAGAALAVLGFR